MCESLQAECVCALAVFSTCNVYYVLLNHIESNTKQQTVSRACSDFSAERLVQNDGCVKKNKKPILVVTQKVADSGAPTVSHQMKRLSIYLFIFLVFGFFLCRGEATKFQRRRCHRLTRQRRS